MRRSASVSHRRAVWLPDARLRLIPFLVLTSRREVSRRTASDSQRRIVFRKLGWVTSGWVALLRWEQVRLCQLCLGYVRHKTFTAHECYNIFSGDQQLESNANVSETSSVSVIRVSAMNDPIRLYISRS
jgi:hypothetical protein